MAVKVTKADGTTDVIFTLTEQKGTQQVFLDMAGGLSEPTTLRVQHFLRPIGAQGVDRHEIVFQKAIVEDTTNKFLLGSVSLRISVPRSQEFTTAMVKDLIAFMTSYVSRTANVTALVNGVTPEGDFDVTGPFNPSLA